jgi:hypothetical protein
MRDRAVGAAGVAKQRSANSGRLPLRGSRLMLANPMEEDRMAAVSQVSTWSPNPGRGMEFMGQVGKAKTMHERMGATINVAQTLSGGTAMSVIYMMTFESGATYGAFLDAIGTDAEWQEFWLGVLGDPTATMISTATYTAVDL